MRDDCSEADTETIVIESEAGSRTIAQSGQGEGLESSAGKEGDTDVFQQDGNDVQRGGSQANGRDESESRSDIGHEKGDASGDKIHGDNLFGEGGDVDDENEDDKDGDDDYQPAEAASIARPALGSSTRSSSLQSGKLGSGGSDFDGATRRSTSPSCSSKSATHASPKVSQSEAIVTLLPNGDVKGKGREHTELEEQEQLLQCR